MLGNGLRRCRAPRGRVVRERGRVVYAEAPWRIRRKVILAPRRTILRSRYGALGRVERPTHGARRILRTFEALGEEHENTLITALNYACSLIQLKRFEEAKSLLRKTMPVARRVLGESRDLTLTLKKVYAESLYGDDSATLDDLREAVTTLEDTTRIARRVFGGSHPTTTEIEGNPYSAPRETPINKNHASPPRNRLCRFGFCFGASVHPYSR